MALTAEERKIYELLNEVEVLNMELSEGFSEYDILLDWEFLEFAQEKNYQELLHALQIDFNDPSPKNLLPALSEARRHLLNFISGNYVVMQNAFTELKNLRESKAFDDVALAWKKLPSVKLIQICRNRIQHGKMLRESIRYEWRTEAHPKGAGKDVFLSLTDETWSAILDEATVEERSYFETINSEPAWTLKKLVEQYYVDCRQLFEPIKSLFRQVYEPEFRHRQGLVDAAESVEQQLEALGVGRAMGSQ